MKKASKATRKAEPEAKAIFLSHAEPDKEHAKDFAAWFKNALGVDSYLSGEIGGGKKWREDVIAALQGCKVGVVLVTSHSAHRDWVHFELGFLSAMGKTIVAIRVDEKGVRKKPTLRTIEDRQFNDWNSRASALKITNDIAEAIGVRVRKGLVPTHCLVPIEREVTDDVLLDIINDHWNDSPHISYLWGVNREQHNLAPVLKHQVFEPFEKAIRTAKHDRWIELQSQYRITVAQDMIRDARESLIAITVVEDDQWLFSTDDSQYLEVNIKSATNLASKGLHAARRLVILKYGDEKRQKTQLRDKLPALQRLEQAGVHLKYLSSADKKRLLEQADYDDTLANILLIDRRWMTVSGGTRKIGRYTTSESEISRVEEQFEHLWTAAHSFVWKAWQ